MASVEIGQQAPSFRLPSGQGPEVGLEDYRGRRRVIVWFTKGMGCPFCRSQMSQLARGYERITALDAELLMVTPTRSERAVSYVRSFKPPFLYLCDPDYRVHGQWGLQRRPRSLGWYAMALYAGSRFPKPESDIAGPGFSLETLQTNLHDTDMGLFLIDRAGVVRWVVSGAYATVQGIRGIPSTDEIVRELERAS